MTNLDILDKYGLKAEHVPKHLKSEYVYRDRFGKETTIKIYGRTRALWYLEWLRLWTLSMSPLSTKPA